MAADQIASEFFIDDSKAEAALRRFDAHVKASDLKVSTLGAEFGKNFEAQLNYASQRQSEFQRRNQQYEAAYARLRSGGGNGYQPSAGEMRYGRINLARQGADVFTQLGSGQGLGITAIQQGPQIIEAMAMSGGKFATAMTTAQQAIVMFGPLLAAGAAAITAVSLITGDIRNRAEERLKVEEQISAEYNRQILANKAITEEFEKQRLQKADDRAFERRLNANKNDLQALERQRATLEHDLQVLINRDKREANYDTLPTKLKTHPGLIAGLVNGIDPAALVRGLGSMLLPEFAKPYLPQNQQNPAVNYDYGATEEENKKTQKERIDARKKERDIVTNQIYELDAVIEEARLKQSSGLNINYNRGTLSIGDQIAAEMDKIKKKSEEMVQVKKILEDVKKQLFDVTNSAFLAYGADNPYVKTFSDIETSVDRVRKATRGFSTDILAAVTALEMQNAKLAIFSQRMDSRLSAFGLRSDAKDFRNPFDPEKLQEQQARWQRAFLQDNPNYLFLQQQEFDARRRDTRDPISLGYTSFDDFIKKDLSRRSNGLFDTPEARLNKKLEAQYDLLYSGRLNERERALADRRFIGLTNGIDPLKASDRVRDAAATARENEAVRQENQEREAQKLRHTQAELQARMLAELEELNKKGSTEGKKALEILLKDETASGVGIQQSQSQATPSDNGDYLNYRGFYQ